MMNHMFPKRTRMTMADYIGPTPSGEMYRLKVSKRVSPEATYNLGKRSIKIVSCRWSDTTNAYITFILIYPNVRVDN